MSLHHAVQDACHSQGFNHTFWVAYSGGLDSHVLLHVLASLRAELPIKMRAVYINHGLSPHADDWRQHCQTVCADLQVDFEHYQIDARAGAGQSPEEVARDGRYAIFKSLLAPQDCLLTAHHQDDQAETVLLQLMRGAGLKGLAAMPAIKSLGQGKLLRPLLAFTRAELQEYASVHALQWIQDESNANTDFSRNFLRHEVLPILKNRWPAAISLLARVADNCADAQQLIDSVLTHDLAAAAGSVPQTLSIAALEQWDKVRQRYIIRAWLASQNFLMPPAIKLEQIQSEVMAAREDKTPCVQWGQVEVRRHQDNLYAMPALTPHDQSPLLWDLSADLRLSTGEVLRAVVRSGVGIRTPHQPITIRYRQGGESLRLPGRDCTHALKNLFQDWHIPTWLRDRIPLVYIGEQLAAVVGYAVADEFSAKPGEPGIVIVSQA